MLPIQLLLVHSPTKGGIYGALSAQVINIRLDVWAPCRALHAFYMQQGLRASPPKGQCEILAACGRSDICALLSCNEKAFFFLCKNFLSAEPRPIHGHPRIPALGLARVEKIGQHATQLILAHPRVARHLGRRGRLRRVGNGLLRRQALLYGALRRADCACAFHRLWAVRAAFWSAPWLWLPLQGRWCWGR